jgi:hypothetical protein
VFYAYYDNILSIFSNSNTSAGWLVFLKIVILVVIGFLIGLIVSLLLKLNISRSFFDWRLLLIVGTLPFIFLILSQGGITNFIVIKFFNANRQISELLFYFFSRQIIWSLWFGFSIGASVRIAFMKKLKHEAIYKLELFK